MNVIKANSNVCIYGTGKNGLSYFDFLKKHRPDVNVAFFMDSYKKGKFEELDIINIEDYQKNSCNVDIIIVCSVFEKEIIESLESKGIKNYTMPVWLKDDKYERNEWESNLGSEASFWADKLENFRYDNETLSGDFKLFDTIAQYLNDDEELCILDIGSGPVSTVGRCWGDKKVNVVAVDPLADEYNEMLEKNGMVPQVKTQKGGFDNIHELFTENHFDFVHTSNSIDHCYDPIAAIKNMLTVLKKDSCMQITCFVNEGERAHYEGLHKWNLCVEDGRLILWNWETRVDIFEHFKDLIKVELLVENINKEDKKARPKLLVVMRKL